MIGPLAGSARAGMYEDRPYPVGVCVEVTFRAAITLPA